MNGCDLWNSKCMSFVTFADSRYDVSMLKKEAESMDMFDRIFIYREHDLDADFMQKTHTIVNKDTRGFGFWIWKPQCVLQALASIPEGHVLLYCDIGCALNNNSQAKARLREYVEIVKNSPSGILSFELENLPEIAWTKRQTLEYFNFITHEQLQSTQYMGNVFLLRNSPHVRKLVQEWLRIATLDNFIYINDTKGSKPEFPQFRDHRHDQSIWSIIRKLNGSVALPHEMEFGLFGKRFEDNTHYPIHALRRKVLL